MDMYENIRIYIQNLVTSGYSTNTATSYEIHLRNFYSYCRQKNINYREVTVKEMLGYKAAISKKYKPESINAKISVINSFYNFLIDVEEATRNPIRKTMYVRMQKQTPKPLSQVDKETFLSYIEQKEKHIELGFKLLFDTGIRISELVNLRKKDIRIINNRVFLYIENGKRNKNRLVPIFDSKIIGELFQYAQGNFDNTLFFFTTRAYQLYAEEFSKKFNIKFSTHMARHTFATEKLNEGMRIDVLRKILGHADIRTTMCYAMTDEAEILKLGGEYYDYRTL